MNTSKNLNIAANSKKFPKLVAFWSAFVEYLMDYLDGRKYKHLYEKDKEK